MTNLLDLPLDQFRGYLAEGNYPQARQDELMRAYRAQNSLSGLLDRYGEEGLEGKNVSTFFPVAGPSGMSIFDALKSGQLQTRFKDYASDALGGVLGALENPRAAYQGTLPQADYDSAAMGTGGLAMGGGGVVAAPAGSLRSFAGRTANTADLDALKVAQELSARKRDPEDIFRQTGWFKGKDGQWRFEIDDSQAEFIGNSQTTGLLGDVIKHDELFAAYPDLKNTPVSTDVQRLQSGSYQPEQTKYPDGRPRYTPLNEEILAFGPTKPAILNTLLHEAGGHALQRREGFAPGSSRGTATDQLLLERNTFLKNLSDKMDARQAELGLSGYRPATNDPELKRLREQYDANVDRALSEDAIYERYYTEAGEVDARNIQLRQDMTPAERRALSPMATEDVPRSEQRLSGDVVNANASKSAGLLAASLPEPRNAGEAMAQRILEMRAAGKAGDVTDEMMAQADPQYMFYNTPLDMSEAARMARAGRFDADAYHATGNDFAQFVPSKFRGASFFGPTPIGASSGASASKNEGIGSGSNITIPVKIDASGVEGLGAYSRKVDNDFRSSLTDRVYSEAELDKMKSNGDFPRYTDWTTFFDDFTDYDALRAFRDANPDGSIPDGIIAFKPKQAIKYGPKLTHDLSGRQFAHYSEGMSEKPTSDYVKSQGNTGFTMSDESGIALAVTNPANIRSRFARFDPEFSHLSNLSAANASAPVGLLAAQPSTEDELRQYLMQRGLLQ